MTRRVLLFAVAFAAAAFAAAHDLWIEPSAFHPRPGETVTLALRVGVNYAGEPLPRYGSLVERFLLSSADGERAIEGDEGDEPAGSIVIPAAGAHVVGYRSTESFVTQDAAKFEQYLSEEGLERVIAIRARRGQSDKASRELFSRCAKALLSAGPGPRAGFDRVLGFTLEIVPEADPESWRPGQRLALRLLFAGRPLEGALVMALPKANPVAGKVSARTDRAGRVALPLAGPGVWCVKAVQMIEADGKRADWQSLWASLTFEIPGPGLVKGAR